MAKNHKITKKQSKKIFTKGVVNIKTLNGNPPIMRGGIRL